MRLAVSAAIAFLFLAVPTTYAHCDWVGGPVVLAARAALEKGDVTPLLRWVRAEDEREIRQAFDRTRQVRTRGDEIRDIADLWFVETLVRLHRTAEGEPYLGLKGEEGRPAGAVIAADEAMAAGELGELEAELVARIRTELRKKFAAARESAAHADHGVEAGRTAVRRYAEFVHFVDALDGTLSATEGAGHHEH